MDSQQLAPPRAPESRAPESQSGSDPSARRHASELDALRAVAIFSVLVSHFLPETSVLNRIQQVFQQGAAFGVPLFFALSGFLITRILADSRASVDSGITTTAHSLRVFYARRFLRIFPLYYATLFVGVLLRYPDVKRALLWHLTYLSNVYYFHRGAFDKGPAPVFWTLSVEEQFYLLWPIMFFLLPSRWLGKFVLAIALIGGALAGWASPRCPVFNTLMPFHLTYLALGSYLGLAGVAPFGSVAKLSKGMMYFLVAVPVCAALWLLVRLILPDGPLGLETRNALRYTATALVFAWVVARLARGLSGWFGAIMRWGPLTFVGKISYGIYVLQFFVTQLIDRAVPRVSVRLGHTEAAWLLQSFPARVAAIIAVAAVSWFLYEKPLNELKRFFPYPRARAQTTAPRHARSDRETRV